MKGKRKGKERFFFGELLFFEGSEAYEIEVDSSSSSVEFKQ